LSRAKEITFIVDSTVLCMGYFATAGIFCKVIKIKKNSYN
jgi:hypothetical protein